MKMQTTSALLIALAFLCALLPNTHAVSPQPDGGYPGGNTAEGTSALATLTTGVQNTALGHQTLLRLTTGNQNTATGFQALLNTSTGTMSCITTLPVALKRPPGFARSTAIPLAPIKQVMGLKRSMPILLVSKTRRSVIERSIRTRPPEPTLHRYPNAL
jgi:hypothetical protein